MTSESSLSQTSELRIVLVGKVGAGKTSVKNSFLRMSEENEKPAYDCLSDTEKCQKEEVKIGGQNVVVVDTPGLCNPDKKDEDVIEEIKKCVSLAYPGPHVFLFVLNLKPFTKEGQGTVEIIKKTFGKNIVDHTIVLFTHGDQLEENRPQFIKESLKHNPNLQMFVDECKGGYHVIDNTTQHLSQVTDLLEKINSLVRENKRKWYVDEAKLRKTIAVSVTGSAVVGTGLGGAVSHFAGSAIGIPAGLAAGAAVGAAAGGVMGGVGIVAAEYLKAKICVMQ